MMQYFKDIFGGIMSLLTGMMVTGKYAFAPTVTVHYPFERINITPNFRGHIDLVVDEKKGFHKCISCGMCERACPSGCIVIKAEKPEGAKKKQLVEYHLDFTKCSLCGNCVEVCPPDALKFSNDYNLVGTSRHDFHFELLSRAMKAAAEAGIDWTPPVIKPKTEKPKEVKEAAAPSDAS